MEYWLIKFLHIMTMFLAVALSIGPELVLRGVIQSGDVRSIRTALQRMAPVNKLTPWAYVLGLVFGIIAIIRSDIDPMAPWLIGSYIIYIIAMGVGGGMVGKWIQRTTQAAIASPDERPSPELAALLEAPAARYGLRINLVLIFLIVLLMVLQPGTRTFV